ncbi:MerR family transcriptional regulator [Pseudalkalibacillus sp. R45]|uniref:MerR family transcriptional regulator n=1 Tax=Pseudalkalibacillus sp. R45 TaxID=3457433 RepID=UPI003FCEB883
MSVDEGSYRERKVIVIGVVKELTGLSERQIRYYEERKLIFPERTAKCTRKYSFSDVETLMEIANKREDGVQTNEIKKEMVSKKKLKKDLVKEEMIRGQLNAHFRNNR